MAFLPYQLRQFYQECQENKIPVPVASYQPELPNLDFPDVHIENEGATLYLGELSPGCQTCKAGTWDCVFTTVKCPLNCAFCLSPHSIPEQYAGSGFGSTPPEIAANYAHTHIQGISFSGGDPLTDPEKLLDWLSYFKTRFPDRYFWLYTAGLLATEEILSRLAEAGLHEIRFNASATGYTHATLLKNLALASRLIPTVTIEIPAIPEHAERLLNALPLWSQQGVRFLNLHELMYEPGSNAASFPGKRQIFITPDGHQTAINPDSRSLIRAVMKKVQTEQLPLSVNDCSIQSKLLQLRGRRRSLLPLTKKPYEKVIDDTFLESYCAYTQESITFFHPDFLPVITQQFPPSRYRFARLLRTAPLSIQDKGRPVKFEIVNLKDVIANA